MEYLNFDLEISPKNDAFYPVVARSEAGEVRHQMLFSLEGQALENALLQMQNALLRAGNVRRGAGTIEEQTVERFGQMLFEALVGPSVRRLYDTSIGWASQQGKGVRVRLNIQAPELATLPWEFLYDPAQREYLCFLPYLALVRYVEIERTPLPLQVKLPLRLLAMMAEPANQPQLDAAAEQQRLEQALAPLAQIGLVELDWVSGQTADDLHQKLLQREWHIFHFIGHGAFDPRHQEGVLALVDKQGQMDLRSATNLGRMLAQHRTLRLVVLNACQGAAGNRHDLFSSTAATFAGKGIPAVLAMQYDITDQAAIAFTRGFYSALAIGMPIDGAVTQARTAITAGLPRTLEWATPVLYLRAPTGQLFEVPQPPNGSWPSWESPLPLIQSPELSTTFSPAVSSAGSVTPLPYQADAAPPGSAPAWEAPPTTVPATPRPPASEKEPSQPIGAAPAESGEEYPLGDPVRPSPVVASKPLATSESSSKKEVGSGPVGFAFPSFSPTSGPVVPPPEPFSNPPPRKRPFVRGVLIILVFLLVLVGGGLGVALWAGNGSANNQAHHSGTTSPTATVTATATPTATVTAAVTPTILPQPAGTVTEFPLSDPNSNPQSITAGPDDNLWFTECDLRTGITCKVGRITTLGGITEYAPPDPADWPDEITAGPDDNLWFTDVNNSIGRITTQGKITEFPLPNHNSSAFAITAGRDGNLWFTECVFPSSGNDDTCSAGKIGRLTPSGVFTEYSLPNTTNFAGGIVAGPDGNLWFTECIPNSSGSTCSNSKIGRFAPTGGFSEYSLPNSTSDPEEITTGPDGDLWFTENASHKIGHITTGGKITEVSPPDSNNSTFSIAPGPDGNLWFTECVVPSSGGCSTTKIGYLTPSGGFTEFPLPDSANGVGNLTAGSDGNVWFTEYDGHKIGRITTGK